MKKNIIIMTLIALMFCFSLIFMTGATAGVMPTVYVPTSILAKPGATFSVPVYIKGVTDAYALGFDLNFDPDVVQLVAVTKGTFMGSANTVFNYGSNIPGKLLLGLTKYGKNVSGAKGDGLVFTLKFKALALGSTKIDYAYCEVFDSTKNNNMLNCNYSPTNVVVSPASKIRKRGDKATLVLTIGKNTMVIDGKAGYATGGSPVLYQNVVYVPIKAIVEELGEIIPGTRPLKI